MTGFPTVMARTWLVYCLTELGEFEEGIVEGYTAIELAELTEHPFSMTQAYHALGTLFLSQGDKAADLARNALAFARALMARGFEAYALWLFGGQHAPQEPLAAEAYYQQALVLANELSMRPLQARCHHGLGTLYATTSQWELARTALSTAFALYRAMDMTFWLPQTEATLMRVEGQEGSHA
jgi:tetratricopeptide (TPR) repeat protein